ncbi:HAUS augmin-like complex subunit 1 isoform X2 [Phalacrocorax aristotelis]|uniref:HAUS augmin-like complex subunit 1 isoform X2 n=1 Tax=Phalacrocorax aristotelis TaxID=126867 RepID=UPI003F4BDBAC
MEASAAAVVTAVEASAAGEAMEGATAMETSAAAEASEGATAMEASASAAAKGKAMEAKLYRIALWLKKVYGNRPVPRYEVNARTIDILYELVKHKEAKDRDMALVAAELKHKAKEYEAQANYLRGILLESLHISPGSTSRKGFGSVNDLVRSTMTLGTKDTSLISDMTSDLYATEAKNIEMQQELTKIGRNLTAALALEKRLQDDLTETEKLLEEERVVLDWKSKDSKFLRRKSEELKYRIKAAKEQLLATGLDRSLTHESLVILSEELAELQKEIVPLKKKLESYLGLPPNIYSATVKIEEAKRELDVLDAEFSKELDLLTFDLPGSSRFGFK